MYEENDEIFELEISKTSDEKYLLITSSSFTCGQIFTLTVNQSEINCPPADFSGDYQISFNVNCL